MRARVPRTVYVLLFLYIAISLGYQIVASVSMVTGILDLRHQVEDPGIVFDSYRPVITSVTAVPRQLGLAARDTVESLNGVPSVARQQVQPARWYPHPGDPLRLGIRKPDGTRAVVAIPLTGFKDKP